jgi:hypothetical protein
MTNDSEKHPVCYGDLDKVFPLREDGFRVSPVECLQCMHKTRCLKLAIGEARGLSVREEMIDRAYRGGVIGFLQRWSQKKTIYRMKRDKSSHNN